MRELLVFTPFNIVLGTLIVIVMVGLRSVLQGFFEVDFLGLGEPLPCGFSPSVVEVKEDVIQMNVLVTSSFQLVEMRRDVADLI